MQVDLTETENGFRHYYQSQYEDKSNVSGTWMNWAFSLLKEPYVSVSKSEAKR